jgi:hypothetical protein
MIRALQASASPVMPVTGTSLQSFIDQLLYQLLAESIRKSDSRVVNEISSEISLMTDESKVFPVIKELLTAVLLNARKGNITLRAERFRDIMIFQIEDRNNYNGYALDYSLLSLEALARVAGGHLSASGQQQLVATISFSFPNGPGYRA